MKERIIILFVMFSVVIFSGCRRKLHVDWPKQTTEISTKNTADNSDKPSPSRTDEIIEEVDLASEKDWEIVGLPHIKNAKSQLLYRVGYITSYNKDTKLPNWVAWRLTSDITSGPYKRCSSYFPDSEVSPRQELVDWKDAKATPYDHGHMCPAGDNKWSRKAMEQTFLLTNICPQNSRLNQETWEHLESRCRFWADTYGVIYIMTGPIFYSTTHQTIGENKVSIPDAFYKVIICVEDTPKAIGFIYENSNPKDDDRMENHVVPITEIEKYTGITFFTNMPEQTNNILKSSTDFNNWKN